MKKVTTVIALTGALVTLAAPAAVAETYKGSRAGSKVAGDVTISSTRTILSGKVWDTKADNHCARLRGNWDRAFAPDHGFEVAVTCGNGTSVYGYESDETDRRARDFEVRTMTGSDHKVVWEGTDGDA